VEQTGDPAQRKHHFHSQTLLWREDVRCRFRGCGASRSEGLSEVSYVWEGGAASGSSEGRHVFLCKSSASAGGNFSAYSDIVELALAGG
jgi:hypothetical protein